MGNVCLLLQRNGYIIEQVHDTVKVLPIDFPALNVYDRHTI